MSCRFHFRTTLLVLTAMLALQQASAQSFYNTTSTVSVLPGTVFAVKDSLVNTGTFINNGNLVIGGTWLNTGSYDAGVGEITFNSPSSSMPQIINHSNQSFSKLTISGGGTKLILADITIVDELVLTDGVIRADNGARVIINPEAIVYDGSDQSHIAAPVYHAGAGEKIFPLGNGSTYLPVTLTDVKDPGAFVGIEVFETGQAMRMSPSLHAVSDLRYWKIDFAEGVPNSRIALPLRDESSMIREDQIVVAQTSDLSERFETLGRSSSEGSLTWGTVVSDRAATKSFVAVASSSGMGELIVYNAVSSNGDGLNDFLRIEGIEQYPYNRFRLFNRWGDLVFDISPYDNQEQVFRGQSNISGEDLMTGTYLYLIETGDGVEARGYLSLRN